MAKPNPIKWPTTVRVGYKTYRVEFPIRVDHQDSLGEAAHSIGRIRVQAGMNDEETANTLLHEVLHGLVWQAVDGCSLLTSAQEELVVRTFANGLCAAMRDNPQLMPTIQRALVGEPSRGSS